MAQNMSQQIICTLQAEPKDTIEGDKTALISEAIDNGLASFGEQFKQSIYFLLKKDYQIEKNEIPTRISEFAKALIEIVGEGSRLIEMKIIQNLHENAKGFIYFPRGDDLVFAEYIESFRLPP